MPTDRELIEIFTVAHMEGVAKAQAGISKLGIGVIALTISMGVLIEVGKAAIENSKSLEEANDQLTQAYATQKDTLAAHEAQIQDFLETNKRVIADQYDTRTALAAVVRAGHDNTEAFRILTRALDMAAIKHESVSDAATTLIKVFAGA